MRRLLTMLALALLAVPTAAVAARMAPGDGTFVVRKATGKITITGKGIIFGRFDSGTLTIVDYNTDDAVDPQVSGADRKVALPGDGKWQYKGDNVRFRFIGGRYKLVFSGATGVDLSAVGSGKATLTGAGPFFVGDYGSVSADGAKFQSLTLAPLTVSFGSPTASTP
jgi:hypothetical protein